MSKLFDQLKEAARKREAAAESSPDKTGLLSRALKRAEAERERAREDGVTAQDPEAAATQQAADRESAEHQAILDRARDDHLAAQDAQRRAEAERLAAAAARQRRAAETAAVAAAKTLAGEAAIARQAAAERERAESEERQAVEARTEAEREATLALEARVAAESNAAEAQRARAKAEERAAAQAKKRAEAEARALEATSAKLEATERALHAAEERERHESHLRAMQLAAHEARTAEQRASASMRQLAPRLERGRWVAIRRGALAGVVGISVVLIVWQFGHRAEQAPAQAPAQSRAWPGMKLDYQLDLTRTGGAARSSLPDPAPSK
ncbi:MAG: hypothetical protein ACXWHZ_06505 [Usitatibacter sp.]